MKLRESQELAADHIYEHDRSLILAKVGSGKTATCLTAMDALHRDGIVKRWLVLAPKRVCLEVWPQEADKWGFTAMSPAVCVGAPAERERALKSYASVVVCNYDNIQWLAKQPLNFDGVVFDELTRLKNPSGERYKALLEVIEPMRVRVGLTGSFTSNGLEDVFGQVRIVDQAILGRSKGAFMQTYFIMMNPEFQEWVPRPGALGRVMEKLKPITYLMDNETYTASLPSLRYVEQRVDLADRQPYIKMKRDLALEFPDAKVIAANSGVVTSKLQQLAGGFVYQSDKQPDPDRPGKWITTQTPHRVGTDKLDLLEDLLEENQHENTLVWYWYKEELDMLRERFPEAETLDAPKALERWNAGKIPLLLAHPMSAGHGINAQFGGSSMVFYSLPWSLELFEQAIGRLHRSGQTREVFVYLLLANKTIDEQIWAALRDKKDLSDIAIEALKSS
jgi:SNF2 family DNA or RNA helicase